MGEVYQRSIWNIAATGAINGHGGLFRRAKSQLPATPCQIDIDCEFHRASYHCFEYNLWSSTVTNTPLNRRAWVLQERFLSPRTLYFGSDQLSWECRELESCEMVPGGLPLISMVTMSIGGTHWTGPQGVKRWRDDVREAVAMASGSCSFRLLQKAYRPWEYIVSIYATCGLSKEEDKLVALSGIAKEMQRLLKDEYLAGLWRRTLVHDLLWNVLYTSKTEQYRKSTLNRSPSWSWASIDSPILFHGATDWHSEKDKTLLNGRVLIEIMETSITALGGDPTGQVLCGAISLRGVIKTAHQNLTSIGQEEGNPCLWTIDGHKLCRMDLDERDFCKANNVTCIPLLLDRRGTIDGLVLAPDQQHEEVYRRIGTFQVQAANFPEPRYRGMAGIDQDALQKVFGILCDTGWLNSHDPAAEWTRATSSESMMRAITLV